MYKVITPAGLIEVPTEEEAKEYKRLFDYPYVKIKEKKEWDTIKEE